jgi:hypothetical protein
MGEQRGDGMTAFKTVMKKIIRVFYKLTQKPVNFLIF